MGAQAAYSSKVGKTTVKLNDKAVSGVEAGRYAVIDRKWKSGDRIEIDLDMSLH